MKHDETSAGYPKFGAKQPNTKCRTVSCQQKAYVCPVTLWRNKGPQGLNPPQFSVERGSPQQLCIQIKQCLRHTAFLLGPPKYKTGRSQFTYKRKPILVGIFVLQSEKPPWCYSAIYFHCILLVFTQQNTWNTSPRFRFSPQQHQTITGTVKGPPWRCNKKSWAASTHRNNGNCDTHFFFEVEGSMLYTVKLMDQSSGLPVSGIFLDSAEAAAGLHVSLADAPSAYTWAGHQESETAEFFFLWGPAPRYWNMPVINDQWIFCPCWPCNIKQILLQQV